MEKMKNLDLYQKSILLLTAIMVLVFSVVYPMTIRKTGFEYKDTILVPNQENGKTTYTGTIKGTEAIFLVYEDKTIEFQYGDKTYGPYTVKEDPTAIPKDDNTLNDAMTGIEIRCGEEILFRGGMLNLSSEFRVLYDEDGSDKTTYITVSADGTQYDEDGNAIDSMEPSSYDILDLVEGPELTHKGERVIWFLGIFFCIATAISILFADELFRFRLSFRVYNVNDVEPSDWEIMGRYISWTAIPIVALVLFIMGLQ